MYGSFMAAKPSPEKPVDPQEIMNAFNARLRLNEERQAELRRRIQLLEQNTLSAEKKQATEVRLLKEELTDVKQTMRNVEDRIVTVIKELQLTPKKEDVDVVKKYMEYWNPVHYITVDKIEEFVRDALQKIHEESQPKILDD